jgi:hypothetical protein
VLLDGILDKVERRDRVEAFFIGDLLHRIERRVAKDPTARQD